MSAPNWNDPATVAADVGRRAGEAMNHGDQARHNSERDWFRRYVSGRENRAELEAIYREAYRKARVI